MPEVPHKQLGRQAARGFSIIELLVSISILVAISTIVLVSHTRFSGSILIENLAYDIALSVRQAQVFGVSVREFGTGSGQFNIGYGVHIDIDTPRTYQIFADVDNSGTFNAGDGTEEVFSIDKNYSIKQFCVTVSAAEVCTGSGGITILDIVFTRPDPDARIRVDGNIMNIYQSAKITVVSTQGVERQITVESTGQISISQN